MGDKGAYDYTLKIDKQGRTRIFNEEGELDRPENSISYMLVGLLSCMGLTAITVLDKMRIEFDKVVIRGLLHMVEGNIRYGDRIECKMSLEGGPELPEDARDRIAQITKKYCTVSVTIEKNPEITLVME